MTRRPRWVTTFSVGAAAVLLAATAIPTLAQSESAAPYPSPNEQPPAPTAGMTSYPDYGGEVVCGKDGQPGTFNGLPYAGNLKSIDASADNKSVAFTFCKPNPAFLAQIAFAALAIDDAQYLIDNMANGTILTEPNGTGPYKVTAWDRGNRMTFAANDAYWGEKALTPSIEFLWTDQAAARLVALQSGLVQGIDNPGKDDIPIIEDDANLKFVPREGLNTFYLGMNNTVEPFDDVRVRQAIAMGIDRDRIVVNFYPPGSTVAEYFTPCAIPFACKGEAYYTFDAAAAKQLLADAGFPDGFETKLQFRTAVRGYLPDPPVIAQEIATQLEQNLGIKVTLDQQESGTFLDNNAAGNLDGIFLLGWGADYPDASNFFDYHFGAGTGVKFGDPIPELVDAIVAGGQSSDPAVREEQYTKANDLIKQHVPAVIVAHGGSGAAYQAGVTGQQASPLTSERFSVTKPAEGDTFVWMQNAEPLSLYCADETDGETLRACEQVKESLYGYKINSTDTEPSLATECTANEDLTVWTCALRDGVMFHNGAELGADDVILSFAAQWDNLSPLHVGRTAVFEYWDSLIGQGKLNPPAPAE